MEVLFYILCATLPVHFLAYAAFWDSLRFKKSIVFATILCGMVLELLGVWYVLHIGHPEWVRPAEFILGPMSALIYFVNVKINPFKLLFTYIVVADYMMIIKALSAVICIRFLHCHPYELWGGIISLAAHILLYPLMYRFFHRAVQQVYRIDAPMLWRMIWLLPALVSLIVLVFTGGMDVELVESWQFLFARIGLLVCVFLIYRVLLQSLEYIQKLTAQREQAAFEAHLLEIQMEEQKKHSLLMMETVQQTKQMRHDMRHQLTAIQALAGNENPTLSQYINNLIEDIPTAIQIHCKNLAVNAIVSHYASICEQEGISFFVKLDVPSQNSNMTDSSLCVIFGNLLENAVEACRRMCEGETFIRLNSRLEYGVLTITMENSFNGTVHMQDGKLYSSKRNGFGIGLSSVQAVAKAHDGDARFEPEGNVFLSLIYVKL